MIKCIESDQVQLYDQIQSLYCRFKSLKKKKNDNIYWITCFVIFWPSVHCLFFSVCKNVPNVFMVSFYSFIFIFILSILYNFITIQSIISIKYQYLQQKKNHPDEVVEFHKNSIFGTKIFSALQKKIKCCHIKIESGDESE